MKLFRVSYRRNLILIYFIISILFSLTLVNMPVKSETYETRISIRESPPGSWIPGVAVDGWVWATVDIESPKAWDDTADGIVGWVFSVHVDPAVLTVWGAYGATFGYFLFDFIDWNGYIGNEPKLLVNEINKTTGDMIQIGEFIFGYETLGKGAGGNSTTGWYGETYGLCRLRFKSKSETAHTLIDIYDAYYAIINASAPGGFTKIPFDVVDDGHYNQPQPSHTLTVESTPIDGINFTVDSGEYMTNATVELEEGNYTVTMPSTWMNGTDQYNFVEWENTSTNPVRSISLTSNMTIIATYEPFGPPVNYTLTVESTPFDGVDFTINSTAYATNTTAIELQPGTYTVTMPSTWMNGTEQYSFMEWEDASTDPVRSISLTSNMTIIATYEPFGPPVNYTLTVESTPFDGVDFTINSTAYATNTTAIELQPGTYNVTMPSTWMNGTEQYSFMEWEDASTDPVRSISLTSNITIIATYELVKTRLYIRESPPGSWIPGVTPAPGPSGEVWVTVDIESPLSWDDTANGIVGWVFSVHVDPAVLTVSGAYAQTFGYFLFDFIDWNGYIGHEPAILVKNISAATGDMIEVGEWIFGYGTLGKGAGGNSELGWYGETNGLVRLRFKSLSETAYTRIDIYDAYWARINTSAPLGYDKIPFDVVDDGRYNEVPVHLTVESTPIDNIDFTLDSTTYTTNTTIELGEGNYTVTMPSVWMNGTSKYYFRRWEDNSTNRVRTLLSLSADKTITATYSPPKEYALTVNSSPITGINFTIDDITHPTNWTGLLLEEDHLVVMNSTWTTAGGVYNFDHWEDDSTNRTRNIPLTSNMTITAFYVPVYNLTVESTPFDGINFKIGATFYKTNTTVPLEKGLYTVTLLDLTKTVNFIKYYFRRWEDSSTNPVRTISLSTDKTITAIYEPPKKYALTVISSPIAGINFTLDIVATRTTNWTGPLYEGPHSVEMPSTWTTADGDVYTFDKWKYDSTNPIRSIPLTSDKTITAIYVLVYHTLTVESTPIDGIDFTIDSTTDTTNATVELKEGNYTVTMPSTWMNGTDQYDFVEWEDNSTNPVRTISLTADMIITAIYEPSPKYALTVNSSPIAGINFTLDIVATRTTNWTGPLYEGAHSVVMPSTWTTVEGEVYNFIQWEDASTSPSRVVSLTSDMTITATYEPKPIPPIASFTFSPTEPIVDDTVTFNASASNDPDGTIVSYAWDFGDGASDSGAIVEHAYTAAGTYNVALTVTDNDGLTHTITKSITIEETPPPGIPWYLFVAAAVAAAFIIAAVAFYFLRIKKPKPT